eukprot:scaffold10225_cov146-Isochrysis_galbana.AAC.1
MPGVVASTGVASSNSMPASRAKELVRGYDHDARCPSPQPEDRVAHNRVICGIGPAGETLDDAGRSRNEPSVLPPSVTTVTNDDNRTDGVRCCVQFCPPRHRMRKCAGVWPTHVVTLQCRAPGSQWAVPVFGVAICRFFTLLFIRDVALIIACATKYTGYEGKRLEGPCPHQSSEQLVEEDEDRGHHNPPAGRWALDAPGRGQGRGSGRHRGGRLASPVRGHLLTQLTHEGHTYTAKQLAKLPRG